MATPVFVGALVLAACGSESDSAGGGSLSTLTSTTTTTTIAGVGGAGAADTTVPPTTADPATTTTELVTTTTTIEPDPAACLIGVWSLRSQEFLDEIVTSIAGDVGDVQSWTHESGDYLMTLNDDGTYLGERKSWTHRISTAEGALITTIDSTDPGTYSVDGNTISINDPGSPATVSILFDDGSGPQSLPFGGTRQVDTAAVSGTGTFTCDGDVLTVNIADLPDGPPGGFDATWDRA